MSSHLTAEVLSAYLDRELVDRQSERVEDHLQDCQRCQQRLDGLRRIVSELNAVGPVTLPSFLGQQVYHRVSLEARPRNLMERLDARMRRWSLPQPSIPFIFALVMALVMVVFFFTTALQRSQPSTVSVIVAAEDAVEARRDIGERSFALSRGVWREVGLAADAQVGATIEIGSTAADELLGELPAIAGLLADGDSVAVMWRGEVVLLRPVPESPPNEP